LSFFSSENCHSYQSLILKNVLQIQVIGGKDKSVRVQQLDFQGSQFPRNAAALSVEVSIYRRRTKARKGWY
jgi:hypothetical protein